MYVIDNLMEKKLISTESLNQTARVVAPIVNLAEQRKARELEEAKAAVRKAAKNLKW
tara:strand:+ start:114 stop:284 length:171 start_codon:yes stop_codon:yes gene_type:complete